jgi:hypothetical protein
LSVLLGLDKRVRIIGLVTFTMLVSCVDLSTICPYKPLSQGLFGEIVDSTNTLEQNIEVDIYTVLNGSADNLIGSNETTRGGYQYMVTGPAPYIVCAKTVCTTVNVPASGIIEVSAVDAASGLTWDAPVAVPPEQMIGPCTWGSD